MTPTELRHLLAHMSLSQCRAADWIGVDERTMRRWCAEEGTPQHRRMPEPAARLLRLLAAQMGVVPQETPDDE
jgi:DNA-binding transcriptional regulator YiaG